MSKNYRLLIWASFCVYTVVVCMISFLAGRNYRSSRIEKPDTLIVYDTIAKPMLQYCYTSRLDTVYLNDTIKSEIKVLHDTINNNVFVEVPIATQVYEDSTYRAVVSGYHASLDSMTVKSKVISNTIIKTEYKSSKFGIGLHAGYDIIQRSPSISLGVNYNIFSF